MRHNVYGKKLGRNKNERTALFKSLVQELVLHGTITTTEAKAKAIKGQIDKIITLAKSKTSQKLLQAYFVNPLLQERLVKEILPKLGTRVSGYTSMIKMGVREGDRSRVVRMSLIGAEQLKPLEKVTSNKTQVTNKIEKKVAPVKKTVAVKKAVVKKPVVKAHPASGGKKAVTRPSSGGKK